MLIQGMAHTYYREKGMPPFVVSGFDLPNGLTIRIDQEHRTLACYLLTEEENGQGPQVHVLNPYTVDIDSHGYELSNPPSIPDRCINRSETRGNGTENAALIAALSDQPAPVAQE